MSLSSWGSYLDLTRLNHPLDAVVIYLPCATGVVHAAALSYWQTLLLPLVLQCLIGWLPISVLQASCANTINDIFDQDLDRKVSRCRNRPLPRGALSTTQASIFAAVQAVALVLLSSWALHGASSTYPIVAVVCSCIYPLGKRITNYPQVILGAMFAAGFLWGYESTGLRLASQAQMVRISAGSMMGVLCLWVVMLDVIYAFQDVADDPSAGVRSLSVRFQNSSQRLFTVLGILYTTLLLVSAVAASLGQCFAVVAGCATMTLFVNLGWVDVTSRASCRWRYRRGFPLTAGIVFLGLFGIACQRGS
ncbi:UbiA prenyltransferase [Aspergillus indologenus CBS 114.80]|uniref:UbiA prenyltransferase n=1 Tax=Aspergillus indologenus CBS 114.80 TaxID=1450541 RepID=A0A2V5ICW8_9EURO|nr:UbiA prenyltransferase [Aspergillus indologenus CBS 114.80]